MIADLATQHDIRRVIELLGLYHVDGFPRIPRPGEYPDPEDKGYVHIPSSLSELDDAQLLDFLTQVGSLSAFAQEQQGLYARRVEEATADLRHEEDKAWRDLYPEGKPKDVTLDQAKINVGGVDEVSQARHLRDMLSQHYAAVVGYANAYSRLSMMATQVVKYRTATGDRMPYAPEPSSEGNHFDTGQGDFQL